MSYLQTNFWIFSFVVVLVGIIWQKYNFGAVIETKLSGSSTRETTEATVEKGCNRVSWQSSKSLTDFLSKVQRPIVFVDNTTVVRCTIDEVFNTAGVDKIDVFFVPGNTPYGPENYDEKAKLSKLYKIPKPIYQNMTVKTDDFKRLITSKTQSIYFSNLKSHQLVEDFSKRIHLLRTIVTDNHKMESTNVIIATKKATSPCILHEYESV